MGKVYWNLIQLRKNKGLTQQAMADLLEMHVSTYNMKENGKLDFNISEAWKLKRLFDVSMDDIFLV